MPICQYFNDNQDTSYSTERLGKEKRYGGNRIDLMDQLGAHGDGSREDQVVGQMKRRDRLQAEIHGIAELSGRSGNLTQGKLSEIY